MDKVLVGTIFSDIKSYILKDWIRNVSSFVYPEFDFYAVDNSSDIKYHKKASNLFERFHRRSNIKNLNVIHNPRNHEDSEIFMADSANVLRKYFLENNYEWLLYLECDIFPPRDILERLLSYNRQIISALYFIGDKSYSYPMLSDFKWYHDGYVLTNNPYIVGFFHLQEFDQPKEIINGGLGCVLIHRDILMSVPFRADMNSKVHHDTVFAQDLWDNGIINHYAPIMCKHENQLWNIQRKMINR